MTVVAAPTHEPCFPDAPPDEATRVVVASTPLPPSGPLKLTVRGTERRAFAGPGSEHGAARTARQFQRSQGGSGVLATTQRPRLKGMSSDRTRRGSVRGNMLGKRRE